MAKKKITKAEKNKKKKALKEAGICPQCKKKYKNQKRKVCTNCGANTKYTEAKAKTIIRLLKLDYPINKMCERVQITKKTFYSWLKIRPSFAEKCQDAKYFASDIARNSVINQMARDGKLALKYLERKEKDEFSTKQVLQNQLPSNELSLDEKRSLKNILEQDGYKVENMDDLDDLEEQGF